MDPKKKPTTLGGQISSPDKYIEKSAIIPSNGVPGMPPMPGNMPAPDAKADEEKVKEMERLKGKLEELKKKIVKKYAFTEALSILPANSFVYFEEDEGVPLEICKTKPIHLLMVIPEDQFKNIPKIKPEIVKMVQETKENLWVHIKTPVDVWNYGLDSKFELEEAIGLGYPLHDKGILGALRVATIHKSLVLRKFEKYVASYVIGGSLARGTADKTSDVDTFVIIDDTDVKRMSRIELLEKLRGMIYDYIREASAMAGVKNILNVQVYLLTDFWQAVKDAQPVMFTFIRDGVPLYDRGTFLPWKLLLRMGKIKPSPEAIDLFMKSGDQTQEMVKRRLMDAMVDIYFGIVTPTQAMMMLVGEAPPVPKTIVGDVKKVLVDREKLMKSSDLKTLEKAVKYYKDYEHGTLKEIPGKEIDKLMEEGEAYNKNLKELRGKIEKRMSEKSVNELYEEVFKLLKMALGNKSQNALVEDFEKKVVKKGKMRVSSLKALKELVRVKPKAKSGKLSYREADSVKRDAIEFINALVEYNQRSDFIAAKKGVVIVEYKGKKAEIVAVGKSIFFVEGSSIKKIGKDKLKDSDKKDFEKALADQKDGEIIGVPGWVFSVLEKEIGKFEISG